MNLVQPQSTHESVNYAALPRQYNAPWTGLMGAVLGAGAGYVAGCLAYDLTALLDPALTAYPSLPILRSLPTVAAELLHIAEGKAAFPPFCWFYAPLLPALAAGTSGLAIGVRMGWIRGERHISGPKFVHQKDIPRLKKHDQPGVTVGPIQFSREDETAGILAIGKSGGGKSTVLVPIARQAIERADRVLIIDFKDDYRKHFGRDAAYIAPWHKNSRRWMLGADIIDEADAEAFAAGLVPDSDDPLWAQAARGIVEGIVMNLQHLTPKKWGWVDLAESLKTLLADAEALQTAIREHRPLVSARLLTMAENTLESIMINITAFGESVVSIGRIEAKLPEKYWSVADWIDNRQPVVIIGWSAQREALSRRVALPIFKMAMQRLLSRADQKPDEPGFWFFIDECGQLGEIPGFISAFTAARSKGGRMVVGFQNFGQPNTFYGEEARAITGCETRIIGRLLNPADAQDASDIAGEQVIERLTVSTTRDGGRTESWPRTVEPAYRKERFYKLGRQHDGVRLAYIGRNVVSEITFPFVPRVAISDEEIAS